MSFLIRQGFDEKDRAQIAQMFWDAFGQKLGKVMYPDEKAIAFFEAAINPDFAISATDEDGNLLGLAGYKTKDGSFTGGSLAELAKQYGWFGAIWRGILLDTLERDISEGTLLMDGIFVTEMARGQGVGSALLDAICADAKSKNLSKVRLDVIDSNPKAKALYKRKGFREIETTKLGPLTHLFGFKAATRMEKLVTET